VREPDLMVKMADVVTDDLRVVRQFVRAARKFPNDGITHRTVAGVMERL
jgi:hypothetical protein